MAAKPPRIHALPLDKIRPGQLAMRAALDNGQLADLATSLSQVGLLNPVRVRESDGGYELIAGHRRCAAAESLGWTEIPAIIDSSDPIKQSVMAWTENHDREGITALDQAAWIQATMQRHGWNQTTAARTLGLSPAHVSELLATLDYPANLRAALDGGAVSHAVARELNRITDPTSLEYHLAQAVEYGCSYRTAQEWVRNWRMAQLQTMPDLPTPDATPAGELIQGANTWICHACREARQDWPVVIRVCSQCSAIISGTAIATPAGADPPAGE